MEDLDLERALLIARYEKRINALLLKHSAEEAALSARVISLLEDQAAAARERQSLTESSSEKVERLHCAFHLEVTEKASNDALDSFVQQAPLYASYFQGVRAMLGAAVVTGVSPAIFFGHGSHEALAAAFNEEPIKRATEAFTTVFAKGAAAYAESSDVCVWQAIFGEALGAAADSGSLRMVIRDTSRWMISQQNERRPDFTGFPLPLPAVHEPCAALVIGQLQPTSGAAFTEAHLGQTISALISLVKTQVGLRFLESRASAAAVGFLLNRTHVAFVRVQLVAVPGGGSHKLSRVSITKSLALNDDGAACLQLLCAMDPARLGLKLPSLLLPFTQSHLPITDLKLRTYLGSGLTSSGFLCDVEVGPAPQASGGPASLPRPPTVVEAVAKVLTGDDKEAIARTEADILVALGRTARHPAIPRWVLPPPQLLASSRDSSARPVLIITPRGTLGYVMPSAGRVAPPGHAFATAAEFCAVVWAVLDLHSRGWVHRDPRPENFFRTDGCFLLADVGSATVYGGTYSPVETRGQSIRYGPIRFLREGSQSPYYPADDFELVARMVFCAGRQADAPFSAHPDVLLPFWERWEGCVDLQVLLTTAEEAGKAVHSDRALAEAATVDAVARFLAVIQSQCPLPTARERQELAIQQDQAVQYAHHEAEKMRTRRLVAAAAATAAFAAVPVLPGGQMEDAVERGSGGGGEGMHEEQ